MNKLSTLVVSVIIGASVVMPLVAQAQTVTTNSSISGLIALYTQLIQLLEQELALLEGGGTVGNSCPMYTFPACTTGNYIPATTNSAGCTVPGHYDCGSSQGSLTATANGSTAPLSVTFTGSNLAPGSYTIDYGDGSATAPATTVVGCTSGCSLSGTHTYTSAGTYHPSLSNGSQIYSTVVVVSAASSQANLSASPTSGTHPLSVSFSYPITTSQESSSFSISFGDGQSGAPQWVCATDGPGGCFEHIQHTYVSAGTYTATMKDSSGNTLSATSVTTQ